jgi:hypothetical protein
MAPGLAAAAHPSGEQGQPQQQQGQEQRPQRPGRIQARQRRHGGAAASVVAAVCLGSLLAATTTAFQAGSFLGGWGKVGYARTRSVGWDWRLFGASTRVKPTSHISHVESSQKNTHVYTHTGPRRHAAGQAQSQRSSGWTPLPTARFPLSMMSTAAVGSKRDVEADGAPAATGGWVY